MSSSRSKDFLGRQGQFTAPTTSASDCPVRGMQIRVPPAGVHRIPGPLDAVNLESYLFGAQDVRVPALTLLGRSRPSDQK